MLRPKLYFCFQAIGGVSSARRNGYWFVPAAPSVQPLVIDRSATDSLEISVFVVGGAHL